jgi:hypothetical protein
LIGVLYNRLFQSLLFLASEQYNLMVAAVIATAVVMMVLPSLYCLQVSQ